ncbi:unnamed protein product [Blumeria hordei]|uniref:Flavin reductase like domain-containing protein n=1 Tax=Blumeria hordei TaxID=2867405 RepID=A0A383UNZ3_BLUHO|nr:unnamed protein product [Blumeria hordei]
MAFYARRVVRILSDASPLSHRSEGMNRVIFEWPHISFRPKKHEHNLSRLSKFQLNAAGQSRMFRSPTIVEVESCKVDGIRDTDSRTTTSATKHTKAKESNLVNITSQDVKTEGDPELLPDEVRQIMRRVPQSVAILTTNKQLHRTDFVDSLEVPRGIGMTLSSVTTVTMKPEPIVSFNIKKPSQTLEAIRNCRNFVLHFPTCTSAGAHLADSFSKGATQLLDNYSQNFLESMRVPISYQGRTIYLPVLLPPTYPISYALMCEVLNNNGLIEVSDHVIVLGKVQKTWSINRDKNEDSGKNLSLGYIGGKYIW